MKNLIYLIISIVISITLTSAVQKTSEKTKIITLQPTDKKVSSVSLRQSADILATRLKLFGIKSSEVNVATDKGEITIQLPESTDVSEIEGLLISKGELAFYETFTHDELSDLFKPDNKLFKLLNINHANNSADPRVGCTSSENMKKTEEYLQAHVHINNCIFFWETKSEKWGYCLFALKTNKDGKPLLVRSDVESVKTITGKEPKDSKIQIKLKSASASIFAEATKVNLNKVIAIVIDDRVYSWPLVRNVIEGGEVEVSGNFTKNEVNYFPSLFNSEQLPVSFKLLK